MAQQENSTRQTCLAGELDSLHLTTEAEPATTFYPTMVEGYLVVSLGTTLAPAVAATANTSDGVARDAFDEGGGGSTAAGVVWNVSASSLLVNGEERLGEGLMDWTVFPSTGLLLPGQR